jgi:hypothetical protein
MLDSCQPLFTPGDTVTCVAPAGVTGKRLVRVSANRSTEGLITVATAAAASIVFGVAGYTAGAGARVTVYRPGCILPVRAAATLTAGTYVAANASGELVAAGAAGTKHCGQLIEDVASGADGHIDFRPGVVPS